jgi:hypothetical protein
MLRSVSLSKGSFEYHGKQGRTSSIASPDIVEINRMKSCYRIFFNQKSLDKFSATKGTENDPTLDNSKVISLVLRPMLLSFVNHRKKMGKYTEDDWFCVEKRGE